jgi:hypothetical protein
MPHLAARRFPRGTRNGRWGRMGTVGLSGQCRMAAMGENVADLHFGGWCYIAATVGADRASELNKTITLLLSKISSVRVT